MICILPLLFTCAVPNQVRKVDFHLDLSKWGALTYEVRRVHDMWLGDRKVTLDGHDVLAFRIKPGSGGQCNLSWDQVTFGKVFGPLQKGSTTITSDGQFAKSAPADMITFLLAMSVPRGPVADSGTFEKKYESDYGTFKLHGKLISVRMENGHDVAQLAIYGEADLKYNVGSEESPVYMKRTEHFEVHSCYDGNEGLITAATVNLLTLNTVEYLTLSDKVRAAASSGVTGRGTSPAPEETRMPPLGSDGE